MSSSNFPNWPQVLAKLREQTGMLAELSADSGRTRGTARIVQPCACAAPRCRSMNSRRAIGHKSVNQVYRQDRAVSRFEGRTLTRKMEQLEKHYREWLGLNAPVHPRRGAPEIPRTRQHFVTARFATRCRAKGVQENLCRRPARARARVRQDDALQIHSRLAAGDTGQVIQDLKPIWLMSPLSVSDTLPLDPICSTW